MSWSANDEKIVSEFAMSHEEYIRELDKLFHCDEDSMTEQIADEWCKTTPGYLVTEKEIEDVLAFIRYINKRLEEEPNKIRNAFSTEILLKLEGLLTCVEETAECLDNFKEACFAVEKDFALEQELRERRFAKPVQYNYIPAVTRNMPYMRRRF